MDLSMRCSRFISPVCILVLASAVAVDPARAEPGKPSADRWHCRNEINRDPECSERERRRLNARFGLPPLETLYRKQPANTDVIIAIASLKLGGGLAMAFRKDFRGVPFAEIRRALPDGSRSRALRVDLSEEVWGALTTRSRTIDTNIYQDDSICTGGAGFTLQMMDSTGTYRARVGDVCSEHPGNWFFEELAQIAIAALPDCAALAPEGYDEAWAGHKLYDCFMLSGERKAAAQAYNFLEGVSFWSTWNSDPTGTASRLADNVAFTWPGRSLPANGAELADGLADPRFEPFRLEATSYTGAEGETVIVSGRIRIRSRNGEWPEYRDFGSFRSVWVKRSDFGFRLRRFTADQNR